MGVVPTIKVRLRADPESGPIVINAADFDKGKYAEFSEPKPEPETEPEPKVKQSKTKRPGKTVEAKNE